jgi:hypothetical protein
MNYLTEQAVSTYIYQTIELIMFMAQILYRIQLVLMDHIGIVELTPVSFFRVQQARVVPQASCAVSISPTKSHWKESQLFF